MPLSDQEIVKRRALANFEFFREYYLDHKSWECQVEWGKTFLENKKVLLLCPGGHGKSWELVDLFTWLTVKNRFEPVYGAGIGEINLVLLSLSSGLAERWIRQIKAYLESPKIVTDFGTFRNSSKWSTDAILVLTPNNKDAMVDHPTINAMGIGGQVFGPRAHAVGFDDVVDKDNSGTIEARKKLWELFAEGPMSWLRPGGRLWGIGTRMNSKDMYAMIMKRAKELVYEDDLTKIYKGLWTVRVDKAVNFDTKRILAPENPEYTLNYFKNDKIDKGTSSFNRRYMNVAIDEADAAFQPEWFPALMDDRRPYGHVPDGVKVYIGVDPAVGKGRGRSRVGIACIGYAKGDTTKRYLIDYVTDQLTPEQQADQIIKWYMQYHAMNVRIEKNACQLYLKNYIQERARKFGINVKIDMTFTGSNKWDIEYGVNVVSAFFENGNFRLPYAESAQEKTHRLRDILLEAPSEKPPDILMAMWFVEQKLQLLAKRRAQNIPINQPDYLSLVGSRGA